ncbi:dynein axonemal heavy chain 9-like [Mycteria americana]|uniref:dynein axonemal heavy chain 9-like n=1 Tax=Mycteria americana TaxID=33587 RepID=UPI003F586172
MWFKSSLRALWLMEVPRVLEKPLEKKAGRNYGPPGTKKLIYFIDDLNMPEVDAYGTVQPHTLIRQHLDYGHWYDRTKLSLKEITNVQYVSCMNPTAGSFTINPRLQRHFCVFALSTPGQDALSRIYSTILTQHLMSGNFSGAVQKSAQQLIALALGLHQKVAATFLPTAIKFHYVFNLRDFSNIFQGLLFSTPECLKQPQDLVKLYLHESNRVYRDKMVEERDYGTFDKIQLEMVKKFYDDIEETLEQTKRMNVYCHFAKGSSEPSYRPVPAWEELNQILVEALDNYNEVNAAMNLVLFEDAMCHVCRINRILESPRGNALLVGVGGSGKQSLTRLAAFISSLEVFQITLRKGYGIPDLKLARPESTPAQGLASALGCANEPSGVDIPFTLVQETWHDLMTCGCVQVIFIMSLKPVPPSAGYFQLSIFSPTRGIF